MSEEMETAGDLLLVEDHPGDIRLVREAFDETRYADTLHVVNDGDAALDFLHRRGDYVDAPRPALVLLDWNLSETSSVSTLTDIKADPELQAIPVIVLSGSKSPKSVSHAYDLHANAYIEKPSSPEGVLELVQTLDEFWFSVAWLPPLEMEEEQDRSRPATE